MNTRLKNITILMMGLFIFVSFVWIVQGSADDEGGNITFPQGGTKLGPVLFSHLNHKKAGNQCKDCHDGLFKKKKGSTDVDNALTMKSMKAGEYCGSCHDGEKAFTVKSNCQKCHVKQ